MLHVSSFSSNSYLTLLPRLPHSDSGNPRSLGAKTTASDTMTQEVCKTFCSSYAYAGIEYGRECCQFQPNITFAIFFCSHTFPLFFFFSDCDNALGGTAAAATDCNMPCAANSAEICGAGSRLTVFQQLSIPTSQNSAGPAPVTSGLPTPWHYGACYA